MNRTIHSIYDRTKFSTTLQPEPEAQQICTVSRVRTTTDAGSVLIRSTESVWSRFYGSSCERDESANDGEIPDLNGLLQYMDKFILYFQVTFVILFSVDIL